MTTQNLVLFEAIGAKMDYINQRQRVISQNVANSDTPGYRPKDLVNEDFGSVLKDIVRDNNAASRVKMDATQKRHIGGADSVRDAQSRKQKETYEVAPAGNAVVMEEQLIKSGQNMMDYNMMINLMQKNVGLIKTAIGRGQ